MNSFLMIILTVSNNLLTTSCKGKRDGKLLLVTSNFHIKRTKILQALINLNLI